MAADRSLFTAADVDVGIDALDKLFDATKGDVTVEQMVRAILDAIVEARRAA